MPTMASGWRSTASRHASMSTFSRKGLATWTAERSSASSWKVREARPDAPWMPSRPVSAPTSTRRLPTPVAFAWTTRLRGSRPTHMALTRGLLA